MKTYHKRGTRILVILLAFAIVCTSLPYTPVISVRAAQTGDQKTWYEASSRINASWGGNIAGEIIITNTDCQARREWQITLPWQVQINSMWNGRYEQTDDGWFITPMDYNMELAPGASVNIGFLAEGEDHELGRLSENSFFTSLGVSITDQKDRENPTDPPMESASAVPKEEPSELPTAVPTQEPSENPAATSTGIPAATSTGIPAATPTGIPTEQPTAAPTQEPLETPTAAPTERPSEQPTAIPTQTALETPTAAPIQTPSIFPTIVPTQFPSEQPTVTPTNVPSETPSASPTANPIGDFYVYTDTVLNEDLVCGNLFLMDGCLVNNGHSITVQKSYFQNGGECILDNTDLIVTESARINAGKFDIRKSSITLGGDLHAEHTASLCFSDSAIQMEGSFIGAVSQTVKLTGGELCIGKDFKVRGRFNAFAQTKIRVGGDVCITGMGAMNPDVYQKTTVDILDMEIGGDLLMDSSGWSKFCKGQIVLRGNLIQTAPSTRKSFKVLDGFLLKFCGEKKQKIELLYPEETTLGIMDFRETPAIEVPDVLCGEQVYDFSKIGKKKSLRLDLNHVELVQDEIIDCENLEWNMGKILGRGYSLSVRGNLVLRGGEQFALSEGTFAVDNLTIDGIKSVYLREEVVKIAGDLLCDTSDFFSQYAGETVIGGNLVVKRGEYMVYRDGNTEIAGDVCVEDQGYLTLQDGNMEIGGSLWIKSEQKSYLDADQILLHGNLVQTADSAFNSLEIGNSCRMVFCGDTRQSIQMAYPYSTKLGILDFRQATEVEIPDEVWASRIYDFSKIGEMESLKLELSNMRLVQDETIRCHHLELVNTNLSIRGFQWTVIGDMTMRRGGDLYCREGSLTAENLILDNIHDGFLTEASLKVSENFVCSAQLVVDLSKIHMQVGKDMTIQKGNCRVFTEGDIRVGGDVRVEGQGALQLDPNNYDNIPDNMVMKIGGSLWIASQNHSQLKEGKLFLHGNLIQTEAASSESLSVDKSFFLEFCGNQKQKIDLAYPKTTYLGTMDFRKATEIEVTDLLCGTQVIDFSKINNKQKLKLGLDDVTLVQDEVIDCQEVEWTGGSLKGYGYDFTVRGNLTMVGGKGLNLQKGIFLVERNLEMRDSQQLYMRECNLAVENLLIQSVGSVSFSDNTVNIEKDFSCAVKNGAGNGGILSVGGNFTIREGNFTQLHEGQTEVQGNVRIIQMGAFNLSSNYILQKYALARIHGNLLFDSSGQSVFHSGRIIIDGNITQVEHTDIDNIVIDGKGFHFELCGSVEQTIDLPGVYEGLNLDLSKSKAVRLKQDYSGSRLIGAEKIVSEDVDRFLDYEDVTLTGDGKIPGNLNCYGNLHINGNHLEVKGDCTQTGSVHITDGGSLEVSGDYIAKQGILSVTGKVHVKGDVRIKRNASVSLAGEKCHFLVEGDYVSASRAEILNRTFDGILELKGDFIQKDSALTAGINLSDIQVIFSGDQTQSVMMPEEKEFGPVRRLDMRDAAEVNLNGIVVQAKQIAGFSQLRTSRELVLKDSMVILEQNETYSGNISMFDSYLACNGYTFCITDGGNLEQMEGVVKPDHGTLYVDGNYSMVGNSILQMIQPDDLLQVKGDFCTDSAFSHEIFLTSGRMELWGDFNQGGAPDSFATTKDFVIAFMGKDQWAHFDDDNLSRFKNIDPDYREVHMRDEPLVFAGRLSYRVLKGVLSGLQEALGINELNGVTVAYLAGIGLTLTAATVLTSGFILAAIGVLGSVVMAITSLISMAEAAHGIYSTAVGPGTSYDKAEAYAHDITLLVLSAINLKGSLTMLSNSVSLCRSAGKELAARKTRLRPSEVIAQARSSKHIVDFDDLISFAGDYLDADGVTFLRETMSEHADCKNVSDLRDVARILELGKEKTGRYLTKEEIKAGLNTLWDDGGVEGAVVAVEQWAKGGGISVAKETNRYVDYLNRAGNKIRIPKQPGKTIDQAITAKLNSKNVGEQIEAKVANYVRNELGKEVTDFRNAVKDSTGQTIADIDCATKDVLIEVKKSVSSINKSQQFLKYSDLNDINYINVAGKKIVLYIDESLENISAMDKAKLDRIEKMGVKIVSGLEGLKGVIE